MAGPSIWNSLKSVLRKNNDSLFLNDCNAFDFSDEIGEEDFPRFKKLQVVVSDDAADTPANGAYVGPHSDDESLLDRDIALRNAAVGPPTDPCNHCTQRRELSKQKKVKRRLVLAAILYLLFMTGELVGKSALQARDWGWVGGSGVVVVVEGGGFVRRGVCAVE